MSVIAIILAGALLSSPQPKIAEALQTGEGYEWTGVSKNLSALSMEFENLAGVSGALEVEPTDLVLSDPLELRALCNTNHRAFALALLRRKCDDGQCKLPAEELARQASIAAKLTSARLQAEDQPRLFLPPDIEFETGPLNREQALLFGAAADLRLRNWTDGLLSSSDEADFYTHAMLMFAWCRLTAENRAAAVAWVSDNGFPSDTDPGQRRLVPALMYTIQHSANDLGAVSTLRAAAEIRFLLGELSAYFFAQILDIERSAFDGTQVVGSLTSCDGAEAIFDPPLYDEATADRIRRDYGLSNRDQYLASASRRCDA